LSVGVGGVYYCLWSTVEEEATVQKETNQNNELKEGKQVPDEMLSLADLTVMSEDTAIPVAEEKIPENLEGEDPADKAKVKDEDEDEDDAYDIPDALSVPILNDCAFHGLNAKQFFQIFFSDNAPFSFQDFQEELGDKNVQYHPWQTQNNTTRLIEFETPTNSPFCKPYSRGTKQQNLLHRSNKCVVMESITSMQDVPFSDCFNVQEQWVITSNNGVDIRLKVTAQINFSKSCTFEYQIRSKTISTLQENLDAWHNVAQRAVRISQRQRQRQRQKEEQARQQKLLGSMECVEVQFSITSNGAFVVGEEEEQEEDWEMDPNPPPRKTKKTRRRRRASLGAIRNTFTKNLKVAKAR